MPAPPRWEIRIYEDEIILMPGAGHVAPSWWQLLRRLDEAVALRVWMRQLREDFPEMPLRVQRTRT